MAKMLPSFITGANAKIKIGDMTMAYAQDVSYSIEVSTIPVETIGRYEVVTNEPVAYFVSGTLSVIRYTKSVGELSSGSGDAIPSANSAGNSINKWVDAASDPNGNIGSHFDPSRLISSRTFDLEILSKLPEDAASGKGTTAKPQESIVKIRDCRLTRKSGSVTKRGLIVDQFAFTAVLADNDADTPSAGSSTDVDLG